MSQPKEKLIGQFSQFIDHQDGTVTDTGTGLMWKRMAEKTESPTITETFSFKQATAIQSDFAGYLDWRLPSIDELGSLLDIRLRPLTFDESVFTGKPKCFFWSSTIHANGSVLSALTRMMYGDSIGYGDMTNQVEYVRLVRNPSSLPFSLMVLKSGAGTGEVQREPYASTYEPGQVVRLTAAAQLGSRFVGWHGDVTGGHPVSNLRMNSAKTVTAEFGCVAGIEGSQATRQAIMLDIDTLQQIATNQEKKFIGRFGHFIDHGDGTVTDTRTGLMWKRRSESAVGDGELTETFSFSQATEMQSDFAGYSDWRLPLIEELRSLFDSRLKPMLDDSVFAAQQGCYFWSSTLNSDPKSGFNGYAWVTKNENGSPCFGNTQTDAEHVRLVRRAIRPELPTVDSTVALDYVGSQPSSESVKALIVPVSAYRAWEGMANLPAPSFMLTAQTKGVGVVGRDPSASSYASGQVVRLPAVAQPSSRFVEFELFALEVKQTGTGSGVITRNLDADEYVQGTKVTLTASAAIGSKFKGWSGDETGQATVCTVTMDSAKTVSAEFVQLESFALDVTATGTGSGIVTRSIDAETYFFGRSVILTAQAAEGSIFSRWLGDATGLEDVCTVQMNAAKLVTAEFEKVSVPDFGVALEFESAKDAQMKSGDAAVIFNLSIFNKGGKQIRIELPLATYVNRLGEEIEQSVWLSGLVIGSDGSTIRAGTFRRIGLVFFNSRLAEVSKGDRLYVTAVQLKPAKRICFTMMCTDAKSRAFMVVNAASEEQQETPEAVETSLAMADVLQRITVLEEGMANLLRILDATPRDSVPAVADTTSKPIHSHTLQLVLTWLASQDRISIAAFRAQLLPLDMLPGAVINEINERALDLIGEIALDEVDDQILVIKNVFDEVLANWNFPQS